MSSTTCREIKLVFQLSKSVVIDKTYTMGDVKRICHDVFNPLISEDVNMLIKDLDISNLDKMNVCSSLDYYKTNVILINSKPNLLSKNKLIKVNEGFLGVIGNSEFEKLKDILNQLYSIKEVFSNPKTSNNDIAYNCIDKSKDFKFSSMNQKDLRKSNGMASTKDFSVIDENLKSKMHESKLNSVQPNNNKNYRNYFSPSHSNFENNDMTRTGISCNRLEQYLQHKGGFLVEKDNHKDLSKSDSYSSIIEKINNEILILKQLNIENIDKKEKLKRNLVKSQEMIKVMKEELENCLSKEKFYEKMLKETHLNNKSYPPITTNLKEKYNQEDKIKIHDLEKYISSLTDKNLNLQKNIRDYDEYTNELKMTISILKSRVSSLETNKEKCMCDIKNEQISNLKKVIDELYIKCEEYEKQKLKEKLDKKQTSTTEKQESKLNLEEVIKIGIEEKDKLIDSLKTTEKNMNAILARYKEDLLTLCTYLKENKKMPDTNNKGQTYLNSQSSQHDTYYDILKKKEIIIEELNKKILNQNQIMKELVKLNNQLSIELKKMCLEGDENEADDYKYQINLLKKINDILINKNTELIIQSENQITCQPLREEQRKNNDINSNEKMNELEVKLNNITEENSLLQRQNNSFKQLLEEKKRIEKDETLFFTLDSTKSTVILLIEKNKKENSIVIESEFALYKTQANLTVVSEITFNFFDEDIIPRDLLKEEISYNKKELRKVYVEEIKKKEQLQKELKTQSDEFKQIKEKEKILEDNLANKDIEISNKIKEISNYVQEVGQMKELINKQDEELKLLLDNSHSENKKVKAKFDEIYSENEQLKSKVLTTEKEKENLQEELNRLNNEVKRINEIQENEKVGYISQSAKLKNDLENSLQQIKLLNEKLDNLDNESYENKEKLKKNIEDDIIKEKEINILKEEKRKNEEKMKQFESKLNDLNKEYNDYKTVKENEIKELKKQKDNELYEVKKRLENEIVSLTQKNLDDKSLLELQNKQLNDLMMKYKFESENIKLIFEKTSLEKDKLLNESFSRSLDPKSVDNLEKEKKNLEIQTYSLINDNKELSRRLEDVKGKYHSVKEDHDRMVKNASKNDLLNRYNILDKKYITLKREYRNIINTSKLEGSALVHTFSNTLNMKDLLSSSEEDEDISGEEEEEESLKKKLVTIKEGTTFIFSVFDSRRILRYDLEYRVFKLLEFADYAGFEENFNPQGSIYLNVTDGLLIVTGENHDMFYQYCYSKNCINKLNKLNDNHSHGGLIYYEKENSLICLSGWHNRRIEKYLSLEISFSFIVEDEAPEKKINQNNKNIWVHMPEMKSERSECPYMIINNQYLYAFFGFNCPKMKCLDTIERLNLDKQEMWEYVKFQNEEHLSTHIKSHSCIRYTEDEILFVGGYDSKNDVPIENFTFYNFKSNKITGSQRKFPDILKNHCYYFQKHFNFIPFIEDHNKKHYVSIDEKDNIHVIEVGSLRYDIYKFDD